MSRFDVNKSEFTDLGFPTSTWGVLSTSLYMNRMMVYRWAMDNMDAMVWATNNPTETNDEYPNFRGAEL